MYPSRRRTLEALGDLSHSEMLQLVSAILEDPDGKDATLVCSVLEEDEDEAAQEPMLGLRGPTGAKAEAIFQRYHETTGLPQPGTLIDKRVFECGFDFEIEGPQGTAYVEVKGLAGSSGGITLTDKEWTTAQETQEAYYLAIVREVASEPSVSIIANPARSLDPTRRIYTAVRVEWSVGGAQLPWRNRP